MSEHISTLGTVFMIGAWISITGLNIYCFSKIFKDRNEDIVDPRPDIDKND